MSDARKDAFLADLQKLLNKHNVSIEIKDDGKPYGMHSALCVVSFNYTEDRPYLEFELPTYMDAEQEGSGDE